MFSLAAELPPNIPPSCVAQAATHYAVPLPALVGMLRQEGGEVGKEYPRSHGTYYGPAQISDKWLPHLEKWSITKTQLRDDACMNASIGAYILAYYYAREKDWTRALARYNVGSLSTPSQKDAGFRYAQKVIGHWGDIHRNWQFGRGSHEPKR